MPGIAFRGGETTLGVHHPYIEEFRDLDPLDQRALARQPIQRAVKSSRHFILEFVKRDCGRYRQAHALDRTRRQGNDRLIGEYGVEHRAAADRTRQRPKTVERE